MRPTIGRFRFALLAALIAANTATFHAAPSPSEKDGAVTIVVRPLALSVKSRLDLEPDIKGSNISVTSAGTVVTLKGKMVSPVMRVKAVEIAKSTEGVTKVVNKIKIAR